MIIYNSKIAKCLTFLKGFQTIMFFGLILTEKNELNEKEKIHEKTHVQQYVDCLAFGLGLSIILMFVLFAFNITNVIPLFIYPIFLYYILYGIELLIKIIKYRNIKIAYQKISFEQQAYYIDSTVHLPCQDQNKYYSFGWLKFI